MCGIVYWPMLLLLLVCDYCVIGIDIDIDIRLIVYDLRFVEFRDLDTSTVICSTVNLFTLTISTWATTTLFTSSLHTIFLANLRSTDALIHSIDSQAPLGTGWCPFVHSDLTHSDAFPTSTIFSVLVSLTLGVIPHSHHHPTYTDGHHDFCTVVPTPVRSHVRACFCPLCSGDFP